MVLALPGRSWSDRGTSRQGPTSPTASRRRNQNFYWNACYDYCFMEPIHKTANCLISKKFRLFTTKHYALHARKYSYIQEHRMNQIFFFNTLFFINQTLIITLKHRNRVYTYRDFWFRKALFTSFYIHYLSYHRSYGDLISFHSLTKIYECMRAIKSIFVHFSVQYSC